MTFARRGDRILFGLSGNPVSSLVQSARFALPALRKMAGWAHPGPAFVTAALAEPARHRADRPAYRPARLSEEGGRLICRLLRDKGSADLFAWREANCLAVLPVGQPGPGRRTVRAGAADGYRLGPPRSSRPRADAPPCGGANPAIARPPSLPAATGRPAPDCSIPDRLSPAAGRIHCGRVAAHHANLSDPNCVCRRNEPKPRMHNAGKTIIGFPRNILAR